MHINKLSVTKIETADRINLLHSNIAAGLNSKNLENLVNCLYPCLDMRHFMTVTQRTPAFRHRN